MTTSALRLLLVEDIPINSEMEALVFRRAGFEVTTAASGEEALDTLDQQEFDVVALDIRLPGLDGLEVVRRIRETARLAHLPVVAITALAMKGDREHALQAGCTEYITKPVDTRTLADSIAQIIHRSSQEHTEPGSTPDQPPAPPGA
jgi:CheY-like chemotaxis protein